MTTPSVVTTQPVALAVVTAVPSMLAGCPPGLEHLAAMDALIVQQKVEALEVFTGLETANRYAILDAYGQRMFFAAEVSNPCVVMLGGKGRPFIIQLLDFFGAPILTLTRDCSCGLACGCGGCCGNEVVVTHISGELLGTVTQICSCCTPEFQIKDGSGQVVFTVQGPGGGDCCPVCTMGPCCTAEFPITLPDGVTRVGVIQKTANLMELVSDANTFGVKFSMPLLPKLKALILAAVFVIDFGYFESTGGGQNRHQHYY